MAPIKLEEHLREKLEKRTLQPSNKAWENLSNRLDYEAKKNNNKSYRWLGLAASLVGIAFIVSQFLSRNVKSETGTEVVTIPEVEIIGQQKTTEVASENETNKQVEDAKTLNNEEAIQRLAIKKSFEINTSNETTAAISEKYKGHIEVVEENKKVEIPAPKLTFEEQKIQDVVAHVHALKKDSKEVTDAYIDALLEQAQKEIMLNRLANKTTDVVDANRLLQDVEAELDQSFRSKVFEAIKSSYSSVKTAVAQRNN